MKSPAKLVLFLSAVAVPSSLHAVAIFAPGDAIQGGLSDGTNFVVGVVGTAPTVNNWPGGEPPTAAIDGAGQKYLNFAEINTGVIVTPTLGAGLGTVVTGLQLWTANDAEPRDPASYSLYGTNTTIAGGGPFAIADFTLISSGALALPSTRNGGGLTVLDPANSQTVTFANTAGYTSYMIIFPTVKDAGAANSMQIAEIQLDGAVVPEPGAAALCGLSLVALVRRRRSS